jgi:hypothetical protein
MKIGFTTLNIEVKILSSLRDSLLPNLMSGKVRVKEVEGKL